MNCAESRTLLHAHADGELDLANSIELERHFNGCTVCAAERQAVQSLKTALRQSSLRYNAPASLRSELRRMARAPSTGARPRLFQSLLPWKLLAFGATALALLTLLIRPGFSEPDRLLDEAVSSHVRSLMADHLTDVASSDQHTVKPWFNGKIDFAPSVKDFAAQGYPLTGGRLDYLEGHSVAALVYRHNQHFINVFVWPAGNAGAGKSSVDHRRGYSIIRREGGGLRYCLVSDLNQEELAKLASLLQQ
jgi:anti-sigma factor RsiW